LLKQFRSINKIRQLTMEELAAVIGPAKAKVVHEHFAG
jgi:excinuclease UvrABC nuclease subunit